MGMREYPPAGVVHVADCDEAPAERLFVLQAAALRGSHDRPHRCVTGAAVRANAEVVIERIDYEVHDYVPSTIFPTDATRELCRTCRGTHGDLPPGGLGVLKVPTALIIP